MALEEADRPTSRPNSEQIGKLRRILSRAKHWFQGANKSTILATGILALSALLAYWLYLSHNRFYIISAGDHLAYEVDRQSGDTWILYKTGKTPREDPAKHDGPLETVPHSERAKITGNASLSGYGRFSGELYNGSAWVIKQVVFQVTAKEANGSVRWSRNFKAQMRIEPLTAGTFAVTVTGDANVGSLTWDISEVWGCRAN
jgi:hypothetical protein